jgi:hypothetical protein
MLSCAVDVGAVSRNESFPRARASDAMRIVAISVLALAIGWSVPAAARDPITAEIDEVQAAGEPILVRLTLESPDAAPLQFWCGGPGRYPGADDLRALIVDASGRVQTAMLSNGQYIMGSGEWLAVPTGTSITLPAMLDPLPAGSYSVRFFGEATMSWPAFPTSTAIAITVRDDAALAARRQSDILARARAGEPFAQHVARTVHGAAVIAGLLVDVASDDEARAARAAETLFGLESIPASLSAPVASAIRKHLAARTEKPLHSLDYIAARIGTDEDLDAVLALCASDLGNQLRFGAVQALRLFPQPRAKEALAQYLADRDPLVAFGAARSLAEKHDPRALATLLAMLADPGWPRWPRMREVYPERADLLMPIAQNFWDDATARDAIHRATRDADEHVRGEAAQALRLH